MKKLYIIGGTMGVGKTATCQILKQKLETKKMVLENIAFLLNNFIHRPAYENIIFCWVMHEQGIIDDILSRLDASGYRVHAISLVCSEEALRKRLQKDVDMRMRTVDVIPRSLARLPMYEKLDTVKINVSSLSPEQAAEIVIGL